VGWRRVACVEAGPADGEPVLLLHGEPSWSFLYRKVMPVLADAGLRAIAADLVGFGRSDKPAEPADHSFARHVAWIRALAFDHLGLRGLTLVGQDWGGLLGLRLVAEHPDRFASVTLVNCGVLPGYRWHYLARIWRTLFLGEAFMRMGTLPAMRLRKRDGLAVASSVPMVLPSFSLTGNSRKVPSGLPCSDSNSTKRRRMKGLSMRRR